MIRLQDELGVLLEWHENDDLEELTHKLKTRTAKLLRFVLAKLNR